MIQRRLLLLATLLALFCESAYGLGLGDLELKSALNQEFSAEIKLMNTEDLAIEEVLPNLASQEDFDRVGVERNYLLVDLRFKVRVEADGSMVVLITSTRPIIEPFLNFIVEVLWPTGRILREYTVLLDPPVFGQQGVASISPTSSSSSGSSASESRSERRAIPEQRNSGSMAADSSNGGEYGMTGAGDTLWGIAMQVRPDDSVSMQQTMLALQKANPDAFISNNINLLKAGHVLRIPARAEILEASASEAIAEARLQNEEFEDYKVSGVAQLDATRRSSGSSGTETRADDGELRLLASDSDSGQGAGDSDARSEALENELAVAREDLDRSKRANSELNVRMDDLAGQLETLNEIVKLKDDQLAALRAQVQKSMEAGDSPVVAAPDETRSSQSLLSNPLVLGGLGIFLVIVVVIVLVVMRQRRQNSGMSDDEFGDVSIDDDDSGNDQAADSTALADTGGGADEDEGVEQQTSDAISEAEIYIAYGRFPQAISFLQNAIEKEPTRSDIQLKLLEVYVQTEDATAFNLQFDQLKALGDEDAIAQATSLQAQIPGASESAEAAMEATIISSEPVTAIGEPEDDDDELSFDLDDLDSETEDDDLGDAEDIDLDLDLDLDLDSDDEITLDLDLDGDSSEVSDDDETELDFGDDLDLDLGDSLELSDDLDLGDDDDDAITLDLDDDEEINLEDELDLGDDDLNLDDDGAITLDLDDDGEIDFGDEDLDLGDDDLELDLSDDDLDLDDDLGELNLDEDTDSKLDLARAYVEMGSNDEAKAKLQEVIAEGSPAEIKEANELLAKLD